MERGDPIKKGVKNKGKEVHKRRKQLKTEWKMEGHRGVKREKEEKRWEQRGKEGQRRGKGGMKGQLSLEKKRDVGQIIYQ